MGPHGRERLHFCFCWCCMWCLPAQCGVVWISFSSCRGLVARGTTRLRACHRHTSGPVVGEVEPIPRGIPVIPTQPLRAVQVQLEAVATPATAPKRSQRAKVLYPRGCQVGPCWETASADCCFAYTLVARPEGAEMENNEKKKPLLICFF